MRSFRLTEPRAESMTAAERNAVNGIINGIGLHAFYDAKKPTTSGGGPRWTANAMPFTV